MKLLLKRLKNTFIDSFSERELSHDPALGELSGLDLGGSEKDTWIANAYLGRPPRDRESVSQGSW